MAVCLVVPSLAQVQKYFGIVGLVVYAAAVPAVLFLAREWEPAEEDARYLTLCTFALVVLAFAILYPLAKSGALGAGSDADDAYNAAVREMLHGRYPYYAKTYLGNLMHALPGSLFLATPFVLLGNSAYQGLFWIGLFFLVFGKTFGYRRGLPALWAVGILCPMVMQQVVTGADALVNGIYVFIALWWMTRNGIGGAILFGLALSSRPNFLLLAPLAFGYLQQHFGMRRAIRDLGVSTAVFLAVTLPFYFYDPAGFAPLEGANRLSRFNDIIPYAGFVLAGLGALLSIVLAWRRVALFASCAVVQAFFVVTGIMLSSLQSRALDLEYSGYGGFFLVFGVVACLC